MLCIIENQKKTAAIEAGTAFRQAYNNAKNIKAILWCVTLSLAVLQLIAAIIDKSIFDLTTTTVIVLGAYVLVGSFGKSWMQTTHTRGCTIQRLHDYLTMRVCSKPNDYELPPSAIKRLSCERLKKHPNDEQELKNWWNVSISKVSFSQSRLICAYSTFAWEVELRRKYQIFLTILLITSLIIPLLIAIISNFSVTEAIVLAIAPFTPFVALVLEEWLGNKNCQCTAAQIKQDCHYNWIKVLEGSTSDEKLMVETNELMSRWQTYRLSTLPIFEWLYNLTQKRMESDMIIDTASLVDQLVTTSSSVIENDPTLNPA